MNLSNQKYWLVGASHGIGHALAWSLARQGAQLVLSARSEPDLSELRDRLNELFPQCCEVLPLDLNDDEQIANAVDAAKQVAITGLIFSAGAYQPMSAKKIDAIYSAKMIRVNFSSCMMLLDRLVPYFVEKKMGHIVLLGSVAGYRGLPNAWSYGASKAALHYVAQSLSLDLADLPIQTQIVCPGFVATRLTSKNKFTMPAIISAERAADYIVAGMKTNKFEICFPKKVSYFFTLLQLLPWRWYHSLVKKIN